MLIASCEGFKLNLYVFAMRNENYKYSELTAKIIGCAMTVHNRLKEWASRNVLSSGDGNRM
jgi:hypothetical protein